MYWVQTILERWSTLRGVGSIPMSSATVYGRLPESGLSALARNEMGVTAT